MASIRHFFVKNEHLARFISRLYCAAGQCGLFLSTCNPNYANLTLVLHRRPSGKRKRQQPMGARGMGPAGTKGQTGMPLQKIAASQPPLSPCSKSAGHGRGVGGGKPPAGFNRRLVKMGMATTGMRQRPGSKETGMRRMWGRRDRAAASQQVCRLHKACDT